MTTTTTTNQPSDAAMAAGELKPILLDYVRSFGNMTDGFLVKVPMRLIYQMIGLCAKAEAAALVIDRALRPATMPGVVVEHVAVLNKLLAGTPAYDGSDPRAKHYRSQRLALNAAISALTAMQPAIQAAVDALEPVGNMEMWTESAADSEMVLMTVGTIRKMRSTLATLRTVTEQGEG